MKDTHQKHCLTASLAAAALTCFSTANAATETWDGGHVSANAWFANVNWADDTAPVDFDDLVFTGTARLNHTSWADLGGGDNDFDINSITFDASAGAFVINNGGGPAGSVIKMHGDITNNDADLQTLNFPFELNSNITVRANSGDITINGVISQDSPRELFFTGAGNTLTLNSANTHSYTRIGGSGVAGGTLIINDSAALGTGGARFDYTGTLELGTSGLNVANDWFIGNWGGGVRTIRLDLAGNATGELSGNMDLRWTLSQGVVTDVGDGDTLTYSGNLSTGAGAGSVTKNGLGTLILSGANTYNSLTTVNDGSLRITGGTGSLPGATVVNDPGTLQLVGNNHNWANTITGDGTVELEFANGGGNTQLTGIGGFTGTVELTRTSGTGGDKWWVNGLSAPSADVIINPTTQLFVTSAATTFNSISVSGTGNNENRGAIRLSSGTLNGDISLLDDTTIGASSGGVITGDIAPTVAGTTTLTLGAPNESSFGSDPLQGVISDGAGTLALEFYNNNTASPIIAGSRSNTYSGGTTLLNSGSGTRLFLTTISGDPYGTGAITIGETATDRAGIMFATANQTLANDIVFNTALGTDRPGIRSDVTGITLSGDVTANLADATFSTNSTGSFNLTGQVTGTNGLTLDNTFGTSITVTLNNAAENNDYAGDTTIAGTKGTLELGAANQIANGVGKGNVVNNGTLNMNGFSDTINGLSGSGTIDGVSGTPTLTVGDNNATATFTGTITDTAGTLSLVKTGSGTQTLAHSSNHSYSGTTDINGGVLEFQSTSGFRSYTGGDININNGSTLRFSVSGGNGYVLDAADTINFDSNGGGLFDVASGNFVVRGSTITTAGGAENTIQGSFNMDASGPVIFDVATGTDAVDLTVDAVLGNSQGILKQGDGTVELTAANSFTGPVTVNEGTLKIGNKFALGTYDTAVTKVTVASGGTVDFNGVIDATYGYTISGTGVGGNGALVNNGGAIATNKAQASNITLAADASIGGTGEWNLLTFGYAATTLDLAGNTLTKVGTNRFHLANSTVTGGAIQIDGGTFSQIGNNKPGGHDLSAVAVSLANTAGATLDLNNLNLSAGSLAGGGATGGNVTLGTGTLTVGALNSNTSYAGEISGTGGLTKTGAGTMTLTGANTYTGDTTVSGGTLLVNNTSGSGTGTGAVAVLSGGTLGGTGTVGGATTFNGGKLSPGAGGIGVLSFQNAIDVSTASPGSLLFDLGAGNASDTVSTGGLGTLDIGVGSLNLSSFTFNNQGIGSGGTYVLFDASSGGTIDGTIANNAYGELFGLKAVLTQSADQVLLTLAVPEPSTTALLGLGLSSLLLRRKRS